MLRGLFFCFFLIISALCHAKPPTLTPKDTRIKVEEILKAHVTYQKLEPEIIKRTLQNYFEEADPSKTYLVESEIVKWIAPSDELVAKTLQGFLKEDFSTFVEMHKVFATAVLRRAELEKKAVEVALPSKVQPSEFKDLKWVKTEEELLERIVRIKSMQLEAAEKLNQDTQNQFQQRLTKRRTNREEELIRKSEAEQLQVVLSLVLKATSSALDSQTAYFTPSEANQFMIQVQQKLFGIGAQLRDELSGFSIMRLLEGGPASVGNKLKVGDRIIAVNQEAVVGMDITEAVELIRGPQGTPVLLTILRESGEENNKKEEKLEVEIVRGEIILKESRYDVNFEPYGDGVIGVITLYSFYADSKNSSTSDLQKALEDLKKDHNLKGVIFDLRNNAGGLLPQAVSVSGLFIKKGIVVSVKDNTQMVQHLRNVDTKLTWDGPLIILTSRGSASAAEIVAGSLQDYGRALIVGDDTTFGKGTFQTFTLESANYGKVNPKGEYKVTRGRYYTVSGKSPQLTGVQADIVVSGIYSQLDLGEKFSKFPLANDQIPPNFEDDLSDIPSSHRNHIKQLYKFNMQKILTTYAPYMDILKQNSAERILANKNYQNFLKEISKKDFNSEAAEVFGQADLQMVEATNIMKDLLFLIEHKATSEQLMPAAS